MVKMKSRHKIPITRIIKIPDVTYMKVSGWMEGLMDSETIVTQMVLPTKDFGLQIDNTAMVWKLGLMAPIIKVLI